MMTDYIKRAESLEDFEACNAENPYWTPPRVKTLLLRQPAADVAPVVHGRWNVVEGRRLDNAICSNCGRHFQAYYEAYCFRPNCGAKMDGAAE
jgi:hypothetical protein